MSSLQNEGARLLLPIIADAWRQKRLLTYQSAAQELGRKKEHARTVAQMCDLLDAAAAFAKVPLIALIVVRESSGHINRKAWTGTWAGTKTPIPGDFKNRVVARSSSWNFSSEDFAAIDNALTALSGLGSHAAWKKVRRDFPGVESELGAMPIDARLDAVDDLGSSSPERRAYVGTRYARDPRIRREVETRSNGCCELCGKRGFEKPDGRHYVETHHIIALANDGEDRLSNVIGLCPEHHREAHFGVRQEELERQMIDRVVRGFKN